MRIGGGLGVAAIVASLLAFAKGDRNSRIDSAAGAKPWMRHALVAFLFLGTQQTLSSLPSSWEGWADTAGLRVPVFLTAGALPMLLIAVHRRQRPSRAVWGLAASYAALVVTG